MNFLPAARPPLMPKLTIDPAPREELYRQATRVAMRDHAIIPLHHQVNIWASRRGVKVIARNDEETYAMSMSPAE